ncbi:unnamed protein product [Natator depressus]
MVQPNGIYHGIMTTSASAQNGKPAPRDAFGQIDSHRASSLEFINSSFQTVHQKKSPGKIHRMKFS